MVPDNKEVSDGDKIRFTCKAQGKPIPEIVWSKGDETIAEDDDISIETKEKSSKLEVESTLCINKTLLSDESDAYKIEAVNPVGNVFHEFGLVGEISDTSHNVYLFSYLILSVECNI